MARFPGLGRRSTDASDGPEQTRPTHGSHPVDPDEGLPVTVTGRYHRPPGGWLFLAAFLVPLALALLGLLIHPAPRATTAARSDGQAAASAPAAAPVGESIRVTTEDGRRVVTAKVPDQASKRALLDGVKAASDGMRVVDEVTVTDGVDAPPVAGIGTILAAGKGVPDLGVLVDRATITLTGTPEEQATGTSTVFAAGQSYPGVRLVDQLRMPSAQPTPSGPVTPLSAECDQLRGQVAEELKQTPIKFSLSGAQVDPTSRQQLLEIGKRMSTCSFNAIEVAGHTDSTGSAALNERLSQQRADAVRAVLVEAGLNEQVMTAKGYGPSKPIADNATPEGQAANRRVEINAS